MNVWLFRELSDFGDQRSGGARPGNDCAEDTIADESTILRFRHLLERHQLTEKIFAEVRSVLEEEARSQSFPKMPLPASMGG